MFGFSDSKKKADITMRLSEFEISEYETPPMQDVLVIGKKAPVGPEAAKRMLENISPAQYEIIKIEHPVIEALIIRKALASMVSKEYLIPMILEEVIKVASETMIIKAQLNIVIQINKSIEL